MSASSDSNTDPGRLLRPFALALGDAERSPTPALDLASMVVAVRSPRPEDETTPERATVLRLCAVPRSVAELASALEVPPSLARLLATEMVAAGVLREGMRPEANPTESLLYAVLEGLRAL